jgi:hypothetical protein
MPCRYDEPPTHTPSPDTSRADKLKKENDILESMLCSACRVLAAKNYCFDENPRLSEWWDKHQKEDEKKELAAAKKRLQREEALEIAKKPFKDLNASDKKILQREGLL